MKALNEMKTRPIVPCDMEQLNLDFGLLPEFPLTAVADLLTLNLEIATVDGVAAQLVIHIFLINYYIFSTENCSAGLVFFLNKFYISLYSLIT